MTQYSISQSRIDEIVATDDTLTPNEIEEFCTADWAEGDEHQRWLNTAPAQEITDWIIAGRTEAA